jgi:hypothetical protein
MHIRTTCVAIKAHVTFCAAFSLTGSGDERNSRNESYGIEEVSPPLT